ncbi:MAG: Arm DNA-binding domain-containing protein [Pseudomonadota bacterium]
MARIRATAKLHILTVREGQAAPDGDHSDGGGLLLRVRGESASWVFRFRSQTGRRREMGMGSFDGPTSNKRGTASQGPGMTRRRRATSCGRASIPSTPVTPARPSIDLALPAAPVVKCVALLLAAAASRQEPPPRYVGGMHTLYFWRCTSPINAADTAHGIASQRPMHNAPCLSRSASSSGP